MLDSSDQAALESEVTDVRSINTLVHLVYIDDSGTVGGSRAKQARFQIIGAVLIEDKHFRPMEEFLLAVRETCANEDEADSFEFHACDIHHRKGLFKNLSHEEVGDIFEGCLLAVEGMPVVYGAVDREKLNTRIYSSANPVDIAFKLCVFGVEEWFQANNSEGLGLLIADKSSESGKGSQKVIRDCFKKLRKRSFYPRRGEELSHIHDDLYFGDSRDSVGLQMADICTYIIMRHLEGKEDTEYLYKRVEKCIVSGKLEPSD